MAEWIAFARCLGRVALPRLERSPWTPTACCDCCLAAAERGDLDHDPADVCPYPPCDWCASRG